MADDPSAQLSAPRSAHSQADLAAEHNMDGFMAALHEKVRRRGARGSQGHRRAALPDHLFQALIAGIGNAGN